ncbi:MAG: outer membrane lipoprotein carrier protein LolA [Nitrospirae bacterium]|nr:outer membrane lipoprotein carrier protein LolA [Nitrospirota bacterium]
MRYINALITLWLFSMLAFSSLSASTVDEDVRKIQDAYGKIMDMKGNFVQKSYIKDLKRTDTYKGSLSIKRPSKMKWEYRTEKPQEVIINNGKIIIYKKTEKEALKGVFTRQSYGQAPVALLSGFGNIRDEFDITKKNNRLILIPKKPMGNIISIELEASDGDFPIKSFVINDHRSNRIEIILENIRINTGIEDSVFDFSLPKGASIYEYNP